jgi:hypothetical protein
MAGNKRMGPSQYGSFMNTPGYNAGQAAPRGNKDKKVPNPRGYNKDQMDAYNYSKAGRYMGPNGPFEVGKKGKNPFNGDTYISKADQDRMSVNANKGLSKADRAYANSWIARGRYESERMRTLKGSDIYSKSELQKMAKRDALSLMKNKITGKSKGR